MAAPHDVGGRRGVGRERCRAAEGDLAAMGACRRHDPVVVRGQHDAVDVGQHPGVVGQHHDGAAPLPGQRRQQPPGRLGPAGRGEVRVLDEVVAALAGLDAAIMGTMVSPLTGADGNVEYFVHARKQ